MIYNMQSLLESQALGQLLAQDVRLSHKQQLESQNRSERRILEVLGRRLNARQRAHLRFNRSKRFELWRFLEKLLKSFTPLKREIMDRLLKLGETFDVITTSASTIAKLIGCCRNTVQEVLTVLRHHGLLVLNKRRYNNSSVKRLHPEFFNVNLKMRLWKLFDSYRDYFQKANRYLKLWLIFQKELTLELSTYNISRFSKDDIQLYKEVHTHSREVTINSTSVVIPDNSEQVEGVEMVEAQANPEEVRQDIRERRREVAASMSPLLRERVTKILHLTAKGQIRLMRYCDGAMLYALECLNKHGLNETSINFRLFESACIEYSRNNDIKIEADANDLLLKELSYVESQACFKRLTLQSPLAQRVATPPAPNKAAYERKSRPKGERTTPYVDNPLPPSATKITRAYERGAREAGQVSPYKQMAMDPVLNEAFAALALKLGYENVLPLQNSVLNSVKNEDK